MIPSAPPRVIPRLDLVVLVACLVAGVWVATYTGDELQTALGLIPPQWNLRFGATNSLKELSGVHVETHRESYAKAFPRSPLATINRIPAVIAGWELCARVRKTGLPFLTIAGLGVGFVAIRPRTKTPGARRLRRGPGQVAAAVYLVLSAAGLIEEFVVRRFDLHTYGFDLDPLPSIWENNTLCVGTAIAAAWGLLLLAGRWKPARGWREMLGLGLGGILLANLLWATVLKHLAQF
ncbi:hypothetical protein V5E97_28400 [Singulisphaera sp. Ch08]|uniref:Uncharacterized protein n=1 Tax=Singulisphaera sp. Ch08 TaxID=3120278 RepID=A0AAU7C9Y3_9BACT